MWTGNKVLDELRNKAALSSTGCITVSIEQLNSILPAKYKSSTEMEIDKTDIIMKWLSDNKYVSRAEIVNYEVAKDLLKRLT